MVGHLKQQGSRCVKVCSEQPGGHIALVTDSTDIRNLCRPSLWDMQFSALDKRTSLVGGGWGSQVATSFRHPILAIQPQYVLCIESYQSDKVWLSRRCCQCFGPHPAVGSISKFRLFSSFLSGEGYAFCTIPVALIDFYFLQSVDTRICSGAHWPSGQPCEAL